jgi:hypothetical protein
MIKVGGAQKGDRTMIDALTLGDEYLQAQGENATLEGLAKATRKGADYAKTLRGSLGRSGYLGDKVIGLPEPGCELVALLFGSF